MISAGETSGDLHGAYLVKEAKRLAPEMEFFGLGGDEMLNEGVTLTAHLKDTAVMGLTEVLTSLWRIAKINLKLRRLLRAEKPAALVLIDSPDFNFPLARQAYKLNIPVIYYICPQIWAWRPGRLNFLAKYCARRAVILPFEKDFYEDRGVAADFVGHPVLDRLAPLSQIAARRELGLDLRNPYLAILPGSRAKIAKTLLPLALKAAEILIGKIPRLNFLLPRAQSLEPALLIKLLRSASPEVAQRLKVFEGHSPQVLAAANAALLASGTAAVEGALAGVPMVVAYKVSSLSYFLAKKLVKVPFIAIPNLLLGRMAIPELIQDKATPPLMAENLYGFLTEGSKRNQITQDLKAVTAKLGTPGAAARVVALIQEEINKAKGLKAERLAL
ncbi:MAG: lipid-A-disaccharide synthase [Deltaproteobacteria bacterium]|jgi:lipid-A-disaccharide synthase|nr:lipid-A-disaccharide synthase [Deltaproteobacteria bacterium]